MTFTTLRDQLINCPVIGYHHFQYPDEGDMQYATTPEKFRQDLKTLLDKGHTFISLRDRWQCVNGLKPWPTKPFVLTMDDGYESNYTHAFPILRELGIHADIFLNTGVVGQRPDGDTPHFTWEQAREMVDSGLVMLQPHGRFHLNNAELTIEQFAENTFGSRDDIIAQFGDRDYWAYAHASAHYVVANFAYAYERGITNQMMNFWLIKPEYLPYNLVARFVCGYDEDINECVAICQEGLAQRL